jgi:hypothetical protein
LLASDQILRLVARGCNGKLAGVMRLTSAGRCDRPLSQSGGDQKSKSTRATLIEPPKLADIGVTKTQLSR